MKISAKVVCILIFFVTGCTAVPGPPISTTPSPTEPAPTGLSSSRLLPAQVITEMVLETNPPSEAPTSTPHQITGWQVTNHLVEFSDMSIVSDREVWAVGENGIIRHDRPKVAHLSSDFDYRGEYPFNGCSCPLRSIDFLSSDNGWLVGWGGALFNWDGKEWIEVIPFSLHNEVDFVDVDFTDEDNGWLVGGGAVRHWNGSEWKDISPESQLGINDITLANVQAISAKELIVIGHVRSRSYEKDGIVLFWDGIRWKEIPNQEGLPEFLDVSGTGENNIRAINWRFIYHWNGTNWKKIENEGYRATPDGKNGTILALPDGDVWIAGYDLLARWDGHALQDMRPENRLIWVVDLEMSDSGTLYALTRQGEIYRLYE